MDRAPSNAPDGRSSAEVVDFDEALLATFSAEVRAELRAEAEMLACALAPAARPAELDSMADTLCRRAPDTGRDVAMDRRRTRGLAAALRSLARDRSG